MARCSSPSIEEFLEQEHQKELLRFTTAGSVDDGKSTLIGRLLYDSKGVYEDQLASVKKASVNRSAGPIDFSLLTDGLRAEREQGITIDVAYRYFATPKRKFIIADTPGHEQYTRNMATGASTAQLAIVLVDARKGVLPQSRRHAFIASLLGDSARRGRRQQDGPGRLPARTSSTQIRSEFREFARDLDISEPPLHSRSARWKATTSSATARGRPGTAAARCCTISKPFPSRCELRRRHAFPGAVRDPADARFSRICGTGCFRSHPTGRSR